MQNEPKKKWLTRGVFVAAIFFTGAVFAGLFNYGLEYTNRTEFCISCHSMGHNLKELQETKHWKSISGVHAGCANCHVPKDFGPKIVAKVLAAKDVWHEMIGTIDTPEKYEAHRLDMAKRVWAKMKESDSRECKTCHAFTHMDFSEQGKFARRKHQNATDRGQTCIDCHKGVAHKLPKGAEDEEESKEGEAKEGEAKPEGEKPAEAAPAPDSGQPPAQPEQKSESGAEGVKQEGAAGSAPAGGENKPADGKQS
jgi:cytochrome c-type protein NapC